MTNPPFMLKTERPVPITIADWKPLCSAELEVRIKIDFELPLSDEIVKLMHPSVRAASDALANLENAIPECKISLDFNEVLDLYRADSEKSTPFISLPPGRIHGLIVFRSVASTADAKDRFLYFTTTVKMPDEKSTEKLVLFLLAKHKRIVYINALETQLELGGDAPQ